MAVLIVSFLSYHPFYQKYNKYYCVWGRTKLSFEYLWPIVAEIYVFRPYINLFGIKMALIGNLWFMKLKPAIH